MLHLITSAAPEIQLLRSYAKQRMKSALPFFLMLFQTKASHRYVSLEAQHPTLTSSLQGTLRLIVWEFSQICKGYSKLNRQPKISQMQNPRPHALVLPILLNHNYIHKWLRSCSQQRAINILFIHTHIQSNTAVVLSQMYSNNECLYIAYV